ncbi:unnamed protein product [Polarella glacialis]|uniref:PHD-type domain-containing protein n=1 Tax=Polarella glacialis TaxID=89957 RepID=A0A813JG86_POLGL|nr:unnamed protein product [Polarella glacialis]
MNIVPAVLSRSELFPGQQKCSDLGPESDSRQYQHVLCVSRSQEARLSQHGALRLSTGYDLADSFIDDGVVDLCIGFPCMLVGSGEFAAYLGPAPGEPAGTCRMKVLNKEVIINQHRSKLLPMPTTCARPVKGQWVVPVKVDKEHERLLGREGLSMSVRRQRPDGSYLIEVWFMHDDPTFPPETVLLPSGQLLALEIARDLPITPWESQWKGTLEQTPQLVNETDQEHKLQLKYGSESSEDSDVESSASRSISSSDSEDEELRVGCLVEVIERLTSHQWAPSAASDHTGEPFSDHASSATSLLHGSHLRSFARLEHLTGDRSRIRLVCSHAVSVEVPSTALVWSSPGRMEKRALCRHCHHGRSGSKLLLCQNFGTTCCDSAHIGCLSPPLDAVPTCPWYCCDACAAVAGPERHVIDEGSDAGRDIGAGATDAPTKRKSQFALARGTKKR